MKLNRVTELIAEKVALERERCAKIADRRANAMFNDDSASVEAMQIAAEIRSAGPPQIKVIRPETAEKHPEMVTPETIIAGASYAGLD